jgi:uncharacterized membrane protein YjjP (DUF1212 family)
MKAKLLAQIASSLIRIERTLNYLANVEGIEITKSLICPTTPKVIRKFLLKEKT